MPPEVWTALTNAGPVAVIMGFMWWLERRQRVEYQDKYEKVLEELPDKLMKHAADRTEADKALKESFTKLTRACWATIKKLERPRRRMTPGEFPAVTSVPPSGGDDD